MANDYYGNGQANYPLTGVPGDLPSLFPEYNINLQQQKKQQKAALQTASSQASGSSGGGGHGGGGYGGGGGGGRRRVTGLEFYRAGRFNPGNLMAQARKEMNVRLQEQLRGTNVARGQARAANATTMRELQNNRMQGLGNAAAQQGQEYARLNNIGLNRGMGYGEGAGANYTNLANQFSERKGGVENQYAQGASSAFDQLAQTMAGYDEADRAFRASMPGLTSELYRQLYNDAYSQWSANQQLLLDAINQRNQARIAMAG